jgi:hypothetical protein
MIQGWGRLKAHAEIGSINTPTSPKLVGHPEQIASPDREPEVVISLCMITSSHWNGQSATDEPE